MTETGQELVKGTRTEPINISFLRRQQNDQQERNRQIAGNRKVVPHTSYVPRIHPELPDDTRIRDLNIKADVHRNWRAGTKSNR